MTSKPSEQLPSPLTPAQPQSRVIIPIEDPDNADNDAILQALHKRNEAASSSSQLTTSSSNKPYTETPGQGWPIVHFEDPLDPQANVKDTQMELWRKSPKVSGRKIIILVHGENSWSTIRSGRLVDAIKTTLSQITQTQEGKIANANEHLTVSENWHPPKMFFRYGFSDQVADRLIKGTHWRTKGLRLHILSMSPVPVSFLGAIGNLSNIDSDELSSIRDDIIDIWYNKGHGLVYNVLRDMYLTKTPTYDPAKFNINEESVDDAVAPIFHALEVSHIATLGRGNSPRPAVRLYISDKLLLRGHWPLLKKAVAETTYHTAFHAKGTFIRGWPCENCHAADHPAGLCPFNSIANDVPLSEPLVPTRTDDKEERKEKKEKKDPGPRSNGPKPNQSSRGRGRGNAKFFR